ncbi:MAG: family transposase [Marmoricola sp.]|nr:family transposase [Marmoricola sp.]
MVAARILADVGNIALFVDRNRFASWTGTARLDASSGEQNRHRLSRAGNRRSDLGHDSSAGTVRISRRAAARSAPSAKRCPEQRADGASASTEEVDRKDEQDEGSGKP